MKLEQFDAILFDSGRVLNDSQSGHWFIGPKFFDFVDKEVFERLDQTHVHEAFKRGMNYLDSIPLIETQEDEHNHFKIFYELFAHSLPELNLSESDVLGLTTDLVYNPLKYRFSEDGLHVIPELAKTHQLAIVSDAWPSLESVYEAADLRKYFSSFVISSQLGTLKPNPKMYQTALEELNIQPGQAIFIDDNIINCLGAHQVGIQSILLVRNKQFFASEKEKGLANGYHVISSLSELL